MGKISNFIDSIDIFGHPVGVNCKGKYSFKTGLGAFCTVAVFVLTILNLTTLIPAYFNNSKLETNTQRSTYDPFVEPAFSLAEYQGEIFVTLSQELRLDIGKVTLYQNIGCQSYELGQGGNWSYSDCKETGRLVEIPPIACSDPQVKEMEDYWVPRIGKDTFEQWIRPYVSCFDSSNLQLQSEADLTNFKSIVVMFENCRDYEESADNCASVDDTNAFWDSNPNGGVLVSVVMPLKQVVLKDIAVPIKPIRPYRSMSLGSATSDFVEYQLVEMAPNEFTSIEDYIGLFDSEPEPETFFSIQKTYINSVKFPIKNSEVLRQPRAIIEMKLSNQKFEHERKVYTLLILISDICGFQGTILMIPAFFLSFYAPKMLEKSLLKDMPIKMKRKKRRNHERSGDPPLGERLQNGQETLKDADMISLIQEMSLTQTIKTGFWETLCHVKSLCGKNRKVKLQERVAERYTSQLDIRSLISVDTNLALLISLLLTRKQQVLFKTNQMRALVEKVEGKDAKTSRSSDSSSDDFKQFHLKAPKLKDKQKKKLFDELLGYSVDSQLDLKLVQGVFGRRYRGHSVQRPSIESERRGNSQVHPEQNLSRNENSVNASLFHDEQPTQLTHSEGYNVRIKVSRGFTTMARVRK